MSSGVQLLWNLKLTVCARETFGIASVAAAAPAANAGGCRNFLRALAARAVERLLVSVGNLMGGNLGILFQRQPLRRSADMLIHLIADFCLALDGGGTPPGRSIGAHVHVNPREDSLSKGVATTLEKERSGSRSEAKNLGVTREPIVPT